MRVAITEETMTVGEAPIGLLLCQDSGEVILKTEYHEDSGRCECFIVSSGERFHGKGDAAIVQVLVLV